VTPKPGSPAAVAAADRAAAAAAEVAKSRGPGAAANRAADVAKSAVSRATGGTDPRTGAFPIGVSYLRTPYGTRLALAVRAYQSNAVVRGRLAAGGTVYGINLAQVQAAMATPLQPVVDQTAALEAAAAVGDVPLTGVGASPHVTKPAMSVGGHGGGYGSSHGGHWPHGHGWHHGYGYGPGYVDYWGPAWSFYGGEWDDGDGDVDDELDAPDHAPIGAHWRERDWGRERRRWRDRWGRERFEPVVAEEIFEVIDDAAPAGAAVVESAPVAVEEEVVVREPFWRRWFGWGGRRHRDWRMGGVGDAPSYGAEYVPPKFDKRVACGRCAG
jgi:hypothetical protein